MRNQNEFIYHIPQSRLGHARDYIPSANLPATINGLAHYTWMDINLCVKLARTKTEQELIEGQSAPINVAEQQYKGLPLLSVAKCYFKAFDDWLKSQKLNGKVILLPVPNSSPLEHYSSFTMACIGRWWSQWSCCTELEVCELVERHKSIPQAHVHCRDVSKRSVWPHLSSIVIAANSTISKTVTTVIILDDVYTTGSQMNAVATLVHNRFPNLSIYGYALAKTVLSVGE